MDAALFEENAEVLRNIASKGRNLSLPRPVDFAHLFPDAASAQEFCIQARQAGFSTEVREYEEEPGMWDVTASKVLIPTCEAITETEEFLAGIAQRYGGHSDGWGFLDPTS